MYLHLFMQQMEFNPAHVSVLLYKNINVSKTYNNVSSGQYYNKLNHLRKYHILKYISLICNSFSYIL